MTREMLPFPGFEDFPEEPKLHITISPKDPDYLDICDAVLYLQQKEWFKYSGALQENDIAASLRDSAKQCEKLAKKLIPLETFLEIDDEASLKLRAASSVSTRLNEARDHLISAYIQLMDARIEILGHADKPDRYSTQKAAVRLAWNLCEQDKRKARSRAKRYIEAAGLDMPEESSLTKWLQELRNVKSPP